MLDRDIWRTANFMINQHGDAAEIQIAMRVDEMMSRGDLAGRDVWRRVLAGVRELSNRAAPGPVN